MKYLSTFVNVVSVVFIFLSGLFIMSSGLIIHGFIVWLCAVYLGVRISLLEGRKMS